MPNTYSESGNTILERIEKATHFTDWVYDQIKPHLRGTILEIGSGSGTYSKKILKDFPENTIVLSDIDERYTQSLKKELANNHRDVAIYTLDLEKESDFKKTEASFDSAF